VENVFCKSFVADIEVFGQRQSVPLVPKGEQLMVMQENKHEFVSLYTDSIRNKSVERQFDAFKRVFYRVCGGNASFLFGLEEIK